MSKSVQLPKDIAALKDSYSSVDIEKGKRILILASPEPAAIAISAMVARMCLVNDRVFHIKFLEPCIFSADTPLSIDKHSIGIMIGVKHLPSFSHDSIYSLSSCDTVGEPSHALAANTLAFVSNNMEITKHDVGMAAIAALLDPVDDSHNRSLIRQAQNLGKIKEQKGFRLPGVSYRPALETLQLCIHPYLDGISGDGERCEAIFHQADIPVAKRITPLLQLTPEESKRLTMNLLPLVSGNLIPLILGTDYDLTDEKEASPLRRVSTISSFARVIWAKREMGLLLGVLIGDRARILRRLTDSYTLHCEETVKATKTLTLTLNDADTKVRERQKSIITSATGISPEVMPEVGRILFETTFEDTEKFFVVNTPETMEVVWSDKPTLATVFEALASAKISCTTTSWNSVRIPSKAPSMRNKVLEVLDDISIEG